MRIVIDFGHPAHVHYFKYFIKEMTERGHEFLCFARERYPIQELLGTYDIKAINRGKGSNKLVGKALSFFRVVLFIYYHSRMFKPDILMSFSGIYTTFAAVLLRAKAISLDDTEIARKVQTVCKPFVDLILTPECYKLDLGSKHVRFPGTFEMAYLHPNRFTPNDFVLKKIGVAKGERYAIVRFVSWSAHHDVGQSGLSYAQKISLIRKLESEMKVFISSEVSMDVDLSRLAVRVSPEEMHDLLYFASLFVGEGATMAEESAALGTPAIYINSITGGVIEDLERHGLLFRFSNSSFDQKAAIDQALNIASEYSDKQVFETRRDMMLHDRIDVTSFLVWLISDYPRSFRKAYDRAVPFDRFVGIREARDTEVEQQC